jgi:hydroxyacylglutathione hydrolase
MLIQRFYDVPLAQASYLLGCLAPGDALVVDPARDPEPYLAAAAAAGLLLRLAPDLVVAPAAIEFSQQRLADLE